MQKKNMILLMLVITLLIPFGLAGLEVGMNGESGVAGNIGVDLNLNPLEINQGGNYTINTNSSDYWNTGDHGPLRNVGDIDHDWLSGLLWSMSGHTMDTSLDMNGNNIEMEGGDILNASQITLNGPNPFLNITTDLAGAEESQINIINTNDFGFAGLRYVNSDGDESFSGLFSRTLSQLLFPAVTGPNESVSGIASVGGPIFMSTTSNHSIFFGTSPDDSLLNSDFSVKIDTELQALVLQGNKYIRPVKTNGVSTMVFESDIGAVDGELTFAHVATNSLNRSVVQQVFQIGKNNSASIQGQNSQIVAPKDFLTMPADVKIQWTNNTGDPIIEEWFSNITSCLVYEEYLQGLGLLPEGLTHFCDTTGRLVPQSILGDLTVVRTATVHEGLTAFNAFDFIGRNGNDVNMLFNGGLENGKLHITDKRLIEANISFFDVIIANFDDATIIPFVSESISPETGRDWDSVLEPECYQDRCGNAKGGNEKVMAFSGATTFEGGTIASSNSRLMFWLTSTLSGADTFEVELDNNEGDVSVIYSTGASLTDEFVNVSFGAAFENRSNVTTRFILNGQNVVREVWVDIVEVTSEPAESIIINESYDGGKVVLGEDRDSLSCLIETEKRLQNGSTQTEWVMNIGSAGCAVNFAGNVTFTDSTVVNQTVIGDQLITGDLTVDGNTTSTYYFGDGSQLTGIIHGLWESIGGFTQLITSEPLLIQDDIVLNTTNTAIRNPENSSRIYFENGAMVVGFT